MIHRGQGSETQREHVQSNARIASVARFRFRFDETSAPVPFLCECGDPDCDEFAPRTLTQYEEARRRGGYLLAVGHHS